MKVAECDIARRRTAPFRLIRPIDTRSQRRRVASSLATAIAIPCSRGCAPIAASRSRHDAACATSDARSFERRAQGSASSQPAPQRNCSATISGAAAGVPADVVKAMVAIATGSLAVPSGSGNNKGRPAGRDWHRDRPGREQRLRGAPHRRVSASRDRSPRSRSRAGHVTETGARAWIMLPDHQQPRRHSCNAAALQRQPSGTKCYFVFRIQQSVPMRRCGRMCLYHPQLRRRVRVCRSARGSDICCPHTGRQMTSPLQIMEVRHIYLVAHRQVPIDALIRGTPFGPSRPPAPTQSSLLTRSRGNLATNPIQASFK